LDGEYISQDIVIVFSFFEESHWHCWCFHHFHNSGKFMVFQCYLFVS